MVEFDRRAFMIGAAGVLAGVAAGVAVPSLASAGVPPASGTHHIFAVDDYGASPGGTSDSAPAIRAAIAAAASWTGGGASRTASVVFSSGVYRIDRASTASWYALEVDGVARVALYGSSTTLLVTTPYAGALSIARSTSMRVEGFTIDYATVPFTQGTITAIDTVAGTVDLQLLSGYPTLADAALFPASNYGTLRNATTGLMKRGGQITFSYTHTGTVLPSGRWRLTIAPDHRPQMGAMAIGDGFVTGFRGNWNGVAIYRCTDVTVASVTMYAAPGAAFIASDSDGTVIRDSVVTRKPGSNRWISANADGVHNHGGRVGPRIFGNTFESLHDDGINIYSTSRAATSVTGATIGLGGGAIPLAPGDVVQIVNTATGTVRGETTVVTVTGDSLAGGPVSATLAAMPSGTAAGDQLFNRSFSAPGADVQYNVFRELRGLGVRLRTSGAYVHANEMFDLAYWGIWVANDPQYNEGPVGSVDSVIERNSIVRPCLDRSVLGWPSAAAGIMIENLRDDYEGGASKPHHGHVVKDNYIEDPPRFGIFVGGAENITVSGNTIASTAGNPRTGAPTAMFGTRNSHAVALSALTVHEYAAIPRAVVWGGAGVTGFTHT
ncbi:hypothetical protein [Microbacterium saperdae]|uniref:Parallel beta helix pectate lyase-like protein n=1 Tax=Microbacterium saperdae TaxID=69368 RepID=A0A543BBT9_9MICO|nr:hypothetical protein [Microbacterium saperdae]TQL82297.1 hypothetical protein FB560_3781 [Microbacterium saperdae]GGM38652.1 hypothetical protein GCM10010489_07150 [Microbacterium saperdae]